MEHTMTDLTDPANLNVVQALCESNSRLRRCHDVSLSKVTMLGQITFHPPDWRNFGGRLPN